MNLYFGNFTATVSTLLISSVFVFIGITIAKRKKITKWGRRIALLALWGLVICCFVATRDGYHLSVQAMIDNSVSAGLFTLDSIQSTLCCIGGAVIAFCSLSSIFVRSQKYRKIMFFVLCITMLFKVLVIEIARIVM